MRHGAGPERGSRAFGMYPRSPVVAEAPVKSRIALQPHDASLAEHVPDQPGRLLRALRSVPNLVLSA
jgi:hypothetical protein